MKNRIYLCILYSLVISILTLFIDSSGRTTLVPGSLPTKSIPSTSHNTKLRQSAENIQNKTAENPIIPGLHQPPYSSFDDFNKKISLLKLTSYHIQYYASYTKIFKFDHEHSVPFIEIYVKINLDFQIRVYLCEEQLRFPDQGLFVENTRNS